MRTRHYLPASLFWFLFIAAACNSLSADIFDDFCCEEDDDYIELHYSKIGGCFINAGQYGTFVPVASFGRRYECADYAVDYSINGGYAKGLSGNPRSVIYYSVPKILCICYYSPYSSSSAYLAGGASLTGIVNNNSGQIFHGVAAEAAFGYEIQRKCQMRSFLQLDVTQPILSAYRKGKFPTPTFQLTFGLGF